MDELYIHPKTGTGHPEQLKGGHNNQWSRRINQKHRLIYEIRDTEVIVIIISAYGHYSDKQPTPNPLSYNCNHLTSITYNPLLHILMPHPIAEQCEVAFQRVVGEDFGHFLCEASCRRHGGRATFEQT